MIGPYAAGIAALQVQPPPPDMIEVTTICPICGTDATWHGFRLTPCDKTVYNRINCPTCGDQRFSLEAAAEATP